MLRGWDLLALPIRSGSPLRRDAIVFLTIALCESSPSAKHSSNPKAYGKGSHPTQNVKCSGGGIRTHDQVVNSHLLCR